MPMIPCFSRIGGAALVTVALFPVVAAAQAVETAKLDETLRESVARGCLGTHPVIITVAPGYREGLRQTLAAHGDVVTGEFPAIDAVAATVHCEDLTALSSFGSVRAVSTNATVGVSAARNRKPVAEPHTPVNEKSLLAREREGKAAKELARNEFLTLGATKFRDIRPTALMLVESDPGLTDTVTDSSLRTSAPVTMAGAGIGVAVSDSVFEPGTDFDNRLTAFYDFTRGDIRAVTAHDDYGHGTHVAGLIGSEFVGVAPYTRLIGLKVLDARGQGATDNVVRAIEFAIANRHVLGINVLNLSLGHPIFEHAATDPLVQAVEHAARVGLTVVVAAGNFGSDPRTGDIGYAGIVSPANAPSAVTVGAVNTFETVTRDDDRVAPYSSRGPSWYDGFAKPDVVAPGHNLLSVAAKGSTLARIQMERGNRGNYMRLSGTSMAAGVTSGVVAVVLQANHRLTPNALKAVLEYTAIPVFKADGARYDALSQGTGQIQVEGAVTLAQLIDPHATLGSVWLSSNFTPSTVIGTKTYVWSQALIWGQRRVAGATLLSEQRPAWANNIVWGEGLGTEDDNIVWGNLSDNDDNIVWGNALDDDDNIVWGSNIVWGNLLGDDDNIVWGNLADDDDNIVWGNNIVWGDSLIGFSIDDDNIVWGNNSQLGSIMNWGGGTIGAGASKARARRTAVRR